MKSCFRKNGIAWLCRAKFLIVSGFIALTVRLILTNVVSDDSTLNTRVFQNVGLENTQSDQFDLSCNRTSCSISCNDTTSTAIAKYLTNEDIKKNCVFSIQLHIQNCTFPSSTMPKHWLDGDYNISDFCLTGGNLNNIEQSAFKTNAFKNLLYLEIRNVKIPNLYGMALSGLDSLKRIKIINGLYNFAPDFFEPIRNTLNTLEIRQVSAMRSPASLIGNLPLNKTSTVDLGSNSFGDFIDENTFDSLVHVTRFFLPSCRITSIGLKAFDKISDTLQSVDLRNNNLTTISGGIFQPLIKARVYIQILGNPWNCDSNLWQLAKYYTEFTIMFFDDNVVCDMPDELKGKPLDTILQLISTTTASSVITEYHPSGYTTESDQTESSTFDEGLFPLTSTEPPYDMANGTDVIVVICTSCSRNICESGSNETDGLLPLKPRNVEFRFKTISPSSVQITVENVEFEFAILWFSDATRNHVQMEINYKDYGLGCRKIVVDNFTITDLQKDTSYTFCIVGNGEIMVSPFNCQSFYIIGGNTTNDYWLLYESQTVIIVISAIGLLLSMFAGSVIMFCLLRCKPTLLKVKNRLVILNKSTTGVMILPKNNRSSTDTVTNTASTIVSSERSSIKRKFSITSIGSEQSYEYVAPELLYEVIDKKDTNAVRKDNFYFERCPQHSPPPLPKRSSSENMFPTNLNISQLPSDYDNYLLANSYA